MTPENPNVGDVVTVSINVCENPGFGAIAFGISSDYLSPITGSDGRVAAALGANFNDLPFNAPFPGGAFGIMTGNSGATGALITVSFEVIASIPSGTTPISLPSLSAFMGFAVLTVDYWCDYCDCVYCNNPCDCPCDYCNDSGDCCEHCNPCECPPIITSADSKSRVFGGAATTFQVTADGAQPIAFTLTNAPGGVTVSSTTGLMTVAGTAAVGQHTFTITATNKYGYYTQTFTLTITAPPPDLGPGPGSGTVTQPPTTPPQSPDVPDLGIFSQYHNAFLIGRPDGTIQPHSNITRAEVATVIFRLLDDDFRSSVWSQQNQFSDVNTYNWFNNAVSTMTNADVLRGMPDGTFRPSDAITRAEFAAIIARFFDETGSGQVAFNDTAGHWAEEYINRLADFGWIRGAGDGNFNPNGLMTRAEVAAIVNRMLNRVKESTDYLLEGRTRWPDKTNMDAWYYLYLQEASHSTEFERTEDGYLRWTEILPHLDWSVLERPTSSPGDIVTTRALQRNISQYEG
ncbi:MAG: S-layer homology domain-containing protein [Oscillospiraceae bacterium]|nr:S-layer homology domain-containing protein [Oscillospiraceae bacterium]